MDSFPLFMGFLVLIGLALLLPMLTCTRRANVERSLQPFWQEQCSGRLGLIGISYPAIRVALYDQFMVVGFIGPTVVPYTEIQSVAAKRGFSLFGTSGVSIKLRGMISGYHFNSRDPVALAKLIEARL